MTMSTGHTVVVVSDHDFARHAGSELINFEEYELWRQDHHECTFEASANQDLDTTMREVGLHDAFRKLIYGIGRCSPC
jgi:hypothetical protein